MRRASERSTRMIASSSGVRELERRKWLQRRSSFPSGSRRSSSRKLSGAVTITLRSWTIATRRTSTALRRASKSRRSASCRSPERGSARVVLASAERATSCRVQQVVLASQSTLAPSSRADLVYRLGAAAQVASQAGAVVADPFDRPDARTRRMIAGETHRICITAGIRSNRSLRDHASAQGHNNCEHVLIAVSANPDHVIHLICKHPV